MKRKLRKYMICMYAAVFLGVFPAEAGQETQLPPAAESSQPPAEEGEETEMPEPVEEGGETKSSEPGEKGEETQVPESGEGGADEDATVQDEDGTVKKGLGGTSSLEPNSVPVTVSGENRENNEESGEQRETAEPFSRENLRGDKCGSHRCRRIPMEQIRWKEEGAAAGRGPEAGSRKTSGRAAACQRAGAEGARGGQKAGVGGSGRRNEAG